MGILVMFFLIPSALLVNKYDHMHYTIITAYHDT